jgi:hypothetical protein
MNRTGDVRGFISRIQRNWRQVRHNAYRFPYHVKLCCIRIDRLKRLKLYNAAFSIQKLARYYIEIMLELRAKKLLAALPVLWRIAKACILKLALWDLVAAKRILKIKMANQIKRWLRQKIFHINLKPRFAAMKAKIEYIAEVFLG